MFEMAQALPYEPSHQYRLAPNSFGGHMRSKITTLLLSPALVVALACGKDKSADPALNNDLSLAAQANPNARLHSLSAAERMNAAAAPANGLAPSAAPVAAPARAAAPVHHA